MDKSTNLRIMNELKGHLAQLRAIPNGSHIGPLDNGPVMDSILEYHSTKGTDFGPFTSDSSRTEVSRGPFAPEDEFNSTLIDAYCSSCKGGVCPFMAGMLNSHTHSIIFRHADLRPANIIVRDGGLVSRALGVCQGVLRLMLAERMGNTASWNHTVVLL